jgi:hypothetical protein
MNTIPRQTIKILLMSLLAAVTASASADPVVYTLRTVADGKLGSHAFSEALVTIRMRADTGNIQQQPSAVTGAVVYTNTGYATVTVDDGVRTTVATFKHDQVYVRYDTGTGIAGFGSAAGATYPIALDCSESQGCTKGDGFLLGSGTLGGLLSAPSNPYVSAETNSLPVSLAHPTLLTGPAFTCATTYTSVCGGPAAQGLHTDRGDFFLQDQIGGSSSDPMPADRGSPFYYGWDLANYGSLQVEVMER